jgi:hypothetical protein
MDLLVQGDVQWILEDMTIPQLSESSWQECFERRFLPSWKKHRNQRDSYRAIFMR